MVKDQLVKSTKMYLTKAWQFLPFSPPPFYSLPPECQFSCQFTLALHDHSGMKHRTDLCRGLQKDYDQNDDYSY